MMIQNSYILNLLKEGKRLDNRKIDEYRKIKIEKNPITQAEGSARIKIGNTEVLVGVKMDVGEPFPDKPEDGVLITNAEFSPLASPNFETGPPREGSIELARVVDRGIRESGAIDTKKLCIKKKEKVWMVFVDVQILNHAGNLIDAAGLGAIVALLNAKMPEYDEKEEKVNYEKKTQPLPVKSNPVPVTQSKVDSTFLIDTNLEEEDVAEGRITITTKDDGNICSIQKSGSSAFTLDEITKAIDNSINKGKELRKLL